MDFDADQIRRTLAALSHEKGESELATLLDAAKASIGHHSSDYNHTTLSLDLRVSVPIFARLESQLDRFEKLIMNRLPRLGVRGEDESVGYANIYAEPPVGAGAVSVKAPTRTDEQRIWQPGKVRVFLSHVSRIKDQVTALKQALAPLGIDGFVAHVDIEPAQAWHQEIEFALQSMHAMCAVVTSDFNNSLWTDQEVGVGLGRNTPVIALRCGHAPYGLLGKHQALTVNPEKLAASAGAIFDVLAKQESVRSRLIESLVASCAASSTFQEAKDSVKKVSSLRADLSDKQILTLLSAAQSNFQVREAINVPTTIGQIAKERKVSIPQKMPASDDFDEDIPF